MQFNLDENAVKFYVEVYKDLSDVELSRLRDEVARRPNKWTLAGAHEVIAGVAAMIGVTVLIMAVIRLLGRGVHRVTGVDQVGWVVAGAAILWGWWAMKVAREARQSDLAIVAAIDRVQH